MLYQSHIKALSSLARLRLFNVLKCTPRSLNPRRLDFIFDLGLVLNRFHIKTSSSTARLRLLTMLMVLMSPFAASAQELAHDGRIRVQLTPYQQTTLSSEIAANVSKLHLREGDSFSEAQKLIEFDCSLINAQLNKAEAAAEAARQTLKVSRRLAELNSISTLEVEQATAKMKETEAEAEAMRVNASKCVLKAPYGGRIAKLHVDAHQYVTSGRPLMDIIDTSRLEVRLLVPSRWLSWLKSGSRFSVMIEEMGKSYQAKVLMLGARIDPVSQSVPIIGQIEGNQGELVSGMSGWASFSKSKR